MTSRSFTTSGFSSTKRSSCSKVRIESVVGITGTSSASAARNTLSDASEMLGGQSRKTRS